MNLATFAKKAIKGCLPYGIVVGVPRLRDYVRKHRPKRKLEFEVHLADHCNLSCKGCTHFSPLAAEKFLDKAAFEKDMARLAELTGKEIARISLLGGEPLLHPDIAGVCNVARKYSNGRIEIITNGILLPRQSKEFWECCRDNRINIIISSYPVRLDRQAITAAAGTYGVPLIWRGGDGVRRWSKIVLNVTGEEARANKNFTRCMFSNECIFLEDGKLATCGLPFYIKHFNAFFGKNIPVSDADFCDIYRVNSLKEITRFLARPIPLCRYCDIEASAYYQDTWGVSKRDISEWT